MTTTRKLIEVVGMNTKRVREIPAPATYSVWSLVGAEWVAGGEGLGYGEAKAEAAERQAQRNPSVRRVTFLPTGTDPRRLGR